MTDDVSAPNQGVPAPRKRNNFNEFLTAIGSRIRGSSDYLLDNPGWLLFWVILVPALEVLASALNIPATLYFLINPPPQGAAEAGHVRAVAMMINASTGIIAPLATLLAIAGLVANGLINKVRDLDTYVRAGHDRLTEERRVILQNFIAELRDGAQQIARSMSHHAHRNIEAFVPAWIVVMGDEVMRDQLAILLTRLRGAIENTKPQDRIIARSLLRGLVRRFGRLMDQIAHAGAFMEPAERRELTDELSHATQSYHVIYWGIARIKDGPWKWHSAYVDFLCRAVTDFKGEVTWTFIVDDDNPVDQEFLKAATQDVTSYGVKCYIFDRSGRDDIPWNEFRDFFKGRGPFFEIFGCGFNSTSRKGIVLTENKITWKATAFGRRVGQRLQLLEPEEAEKYATGEGVWAADDIDKVVRAGLVTSTTDTEFRLLNQVQTRRKAA